MMVRLSFWVALGVVLLAGCAGSSPSTPTGPSQPETSLSCSAEGFGIQSGAVLQVANAVPEEYIVVLNDDLRQLFATAALMRSVVRDFVGLEEVEVLMVVDL